MSIQRIELSRPAGYQGLSYLLPPEMKEFGDELTRRLQVNSDQLMNQLRDQVVVDTSVLPNLGNGEATTGTTTTATTADVEQALLIALMR